MDYPIAWFRLFDLTPIIGDFLHAYGNRHEVITTLNTKDKQDADRVNADEVSKDVPYSTSCSIAPGSHVPIYNENFTALLPYEKKTFT